MPTSEDSSPDLSLEALVERQPGYPVDAYVFVQRGLHATVKKVMEAEGLEAGRHVSGDELSIGLRDYALDRWGRLARIVLARWGITQTLDFGQIVFSLVEHGIFTTTEEDSLDDFRDIFDFATAFETAYQLPAAS